MMIGNSPAPFPKLPKSWRTPNAGLSVADACQSWYSAAYLLETVPSVLYILMRCAQDPEEAIVHAVNDTKDNDTIAAIVGAAIGALYGRSGLPPRWVTELPGRVSGDDDGRLFALLDQARNTCGFQTGQPIG